MHASPNRLTTNHRLRFMSIFALCALFAATIALVATPRPTLAATDADVSDGASFLVEHITDTDEVGSNGSAMRDSTVDGSDTGNASFRDDPSIDGTSSFAFYLTHDAVDGGYVTFGRLNTSFDGSDTAIPMNFRQGISSDSGWVVIAEASAFWNGCMYGLVTPAGWAVNASNPDTLTLTDGLGRTFTFGADGSLNGPDMALAIALSNDLRLCRQGGPAPRLELDPKPESDPSPAHWADRYRAAF